MEFTCGPKVFMFFGATGNRKVNHQIIIATSFRPDDALSNLSRNIRGIPSNEQ